MLSKYVSDNIAEEMLAKSMQIYFHRKTGCFKYVWYVCTAMNSSGRHWMEHQDCIRKSSWQHCTKDLYCEEQRYWIKNFPRGKDWKTRLFNMANGDGGWFHARFSVIFLWLTFLSFIELLASIINLHEITHYKITNKKGSNGGSQLASLVPT